MDTITRWFYQIRVLLVWLIGFALILSILALLHELFLFFIVNTLHWDRDTARFLSMLYYVPAGVVTIAYIALVFPILNQQSRQTSFLKKTLLLFGIQLPCIGLIQLGLIVYRYLQASAFNLILVTTEVLAGIILLYFALKRPKQLTG